MKPKPCHPTGRIRRGVRPRRPLNLCLCLCLCASLLACGEQAQAPKLPPALAYPAVDDAPYADRLVPCTYNIEGEMSCPVKDLPPLGLQISEPTRPDIMQRVAISHAWMATRFEQLLARMPAEVFLLARSLTGVVIGSHIRPSYYRTQTGALYLDPGLMWLSRAEKRTINPTPDQRNGFGEDLQFRILFRYVLNNRPAWNKYSLDDESERQFDDIVHGFARELFHELAHVADFLPADQLGSIDQELTIHAAIGQIGRRKQQVSQRLQADAPLRSSRMTEYANVRYKGWAASAELQAMGPRDVVDEFSVDGANTAYNYVSRAEDTAQLFEELMLDRSFGIQRDIAITPPPETGQDYRVHWGQRHRIAEEQVRQRASLVVQGLLPEVDFSAYFGSLDRAEALPAGADWQTTVDSSR